MLTNYLIQIFESTQDAVSVSDKAGTMLYVNSTHAILTGVKPHDIIGKNVVDLVKEGIFDMVLNPEVVRTRNKITRIQTTADGKKLVLEANPIFDEDNNVAYVTTFIRNITVLTELQTKLTKQNELLMAFQELQNPHITEVIASKPMRKLYASLDNIAKTDASILLLGETGVGKDVFARTVHNLSERSHKPFIKIDCGSIPENLIETELFGYTAGTFSGANKNGKIGLVEAANNGTLFLDEIGELPLTVQTRFLRFLQDKEIIRVGATTPCRVDARIVAATNRDLEKEVQKGRFRSDLYYRLKVAVFEIPPLRKRQEDILPLARTFLTQYGTKYGKRMVLSEQAEQLLLHYQWPGNVRELENTIQSLIVSQNKAVLDVSDFTITAQEETSSQELADKLANITLEGRNYKDIMQEVEKHIITQGIKQFGSIAETARQFQVNRCTLFRKLKEES